MAPVIKRWLPDLKTTVESIEKVCASRENLLRWVKSAFEQRQETVKLVCHPCQPGNEDSASEFADGFKMYAYCKKHLTLDGKACPVHWKVERRAGMMHIEQNAWGVLVIFPEKRLHMDPCHGWLPDWRQAWSRQGTPRNAKQSVKRSRVQKIMSESAFCEKRSAALTENHGTGSEEGEDHAAGTCPNTARHQQGVGECRGFSQDLPGFVPVP